MEPLRKSRLNIDCTIEEKRQIRILAAKQDKTISQYILGLVRQDSEFDESSESTQSSKLVSQQTSNTVLPLALDASLI